MDISSNAGVSAALAATQSAQSGDVQMTMLSSALKMQASSAAQLLQALPPPVLATSGTLGTRVNNYA